MSEIENDTMPSEKVETSEEPQGEEISASEMMRFKAFMVIQVLFLFLSPLCGGFHYALWSMLDTAFLLLGIGISALALVLETRRARKLVFRIAGTLYVLGLVDMSINILLSGVLGWRGLPIGD